jgi:hypothetical protein
MRAISFIVILFVLVGCSGPRLKFAVANHLSEEITNVEVRLPDTTLFFASVKPKTKTDWIRVTRAYAYGYMKFKNGHDSEIVFLPVDFTGEKLYKGGYMQFMLYYPDSSSRSIGTAYSRSPLMRSRVPKDKE